MKVGLCFAILFLSLVACGGGPTAPELSEITLSQTEITYADEFFASFEATDPDGDLDRATVTIRIRGPEDAEEIDLEEDVVVAEAGTGETEVSMAVALKLTGQMPLGIYQLLLHVTDNGGKKSGPAKARINLVPGGGNPGIPISLD